MHQTLRPDSTELGHSTAGVDGGTAAPLIDVLWRRRWTLVLTVATALFLAAIYLAIATPVYTATARVQIHENSPKLLNESRETATRSENYLQTQADVFESTTVLSRALEKAKYTELKMFQGVSGDPVEWLRRSGALTIDVPRKTDTVAVTMESAYPEEAAEIANSIVNAFIVEQALERRSTGSEMVAVLQKERDELQLKRDAALQQMLKNKRRSGVLSFSAEKGNTVLDRITTLSSSLTSAEMATIELKAERDSLQAAMATAASMTALVQAQQAKGQEHADREYGELRSQLLQHSLAMSTSLAVQGPNHSRVRALQSVIDTLKKQITAKEREIVQSQLAAANSQVAAAEAKERQLRDTLRTQQDLALDQSPEAVEYRKLEMDVERLQRQCDLLDSRMAEIRLNTVDVGPLSVSVLEAARPAEKAIKPKKSLTLFAALMAGWVIGIGLSMLREWQDARLRTPEEIRAVLGTQVIAMIPQINPQYSPVTRGQLVRLDARSAASESYRGIRTLLQLGSSNAAKTILIASPASGDGKSTTASNLGIAFAQSGDRTLIVDCDLRHPVQHLIFEMNGHIGVSDVLAGESKLRDAIRHTHVPGLYVLPCGPVPDSPSELLTSKKFARLMQALGKTFDRIIIDSPPLMTVTDGRILAASADATLLVVRMNRSMRRLGVQALDGLDKVGANVLGAIANDVAGTDRTVNTYGEMVQYEMDTRRMLNIAQDRLPNEGSDASAPVLAIAEPDWSSERK